MITSVDAYECVVHSIIFKGIKKQINAVSVISRLVKLDHFSPNLNFFCHLFLPFCQPLIMKCTVVSVFCFSSVSSDVWAQKGFTRNYSACLHTGLLQMLPHQNEFVNCTSLLKWRVATEYVQLWSIYFLYLRLNRCKIFGENSALSYINYICLDRWNVAWQQTLVFYSYQGIKAYSILLNSNI